MKLLKLLVFAALGGLTACGGDSWKSPVEPITKPRSELQAEIQLKTPQANLTYTKLYRENNILFGIAKGSGVQIIDNTEPDEPNGVAFLQLPGVEDVVIEGDTIVTNQYADLVVFSQAQKKEVGRINDVYHYQSYVELPDDKRWPDEVVVPGGEVVVGYRIPEKKESKDDGFCFLFCW